MIHTPTSFSRSNTSRLIVFNAFSCRWIITAAIAAVVFVVDQTTKYFSFASDRMSDLTVIPGLFGFIHHENRGIIANIPIPLWMIIALTVLILIAVCVAVVQSVKQGRFLRLIAFALIIAGAAGNLFDRMTLGYVRDWILLFNRSVVNVADLSILVGIVLLLVKERR